MPQRPFPAQDDRAILFTAKHCLPPFTHVDSWLEATIIAFSMRATQLPSIALGITHAKHLVPDLTQYPDAVWAPIEALQLFWQHPSWGNTICDTDHTHACGMHTHLHLVTGLWLVLSLLSLYVDLVLTIHLCCCEILLMHAHSSISTVCCIAMLS